MPQLATPGGVRRHKAATAKKAAKKAAPRASVPITIRKAPKNSLTDVHVLDRVKARVGQTWSTCELVVKTYLEEFFHELEGSNNGDGVSMQGFLVLKRYDTSLRPPTTKRVAGSVVSVPARFPRSSAKLFLKKKARQILEQNDSD